jgi:glutamine synthetase adenylyltransferase
MSFEEIKDRVMSMDETDQKRLITEVVPQVWERACDDTSCALKLKELVDRDIVRPYDEMPMDDDMFIGI